MRSLENAKEEIEDLLLSGDAVNVIDLAIQLQRNDVLADIEETLERLDMKMDDVAKKIDEISYWKSLER